MKGGVWVFVFSSAIFVSGAASALADFQLQSITLHPQDSALSCSESVSGQIYYVSSTDQLMVCNGAANIPLVTGTNYWTLSGSNLYPASTGYNVGIGTTNPGAKLAVVGTASITGVTNIASPVDTTGILNVQTTGTDRIITLNGGGGTSTSTWWMVVNSNYDAFSYNLWSASGGNLFRLRHNGSGYFSQGPIGIGTTAPTTAGLVVATNVSGAAVDVNNNRIINVGTPINAADAATKSYVDSVVTPPGGGTSGFWTLSGSNLYPASTGYNVGIGTASPYDKLAVSGNVGQLFSGAYGDSWGSFNLLGSMDMTSYPFYQTAGKTYQGLQIANSSDNLFLGLENNGSNLQQAIIGWGDDGDNTLQFRFNNGIIGSVSPSGVATFNSAVNTSIFYDQDNTNYYLDPAANVMPYALNANGYVKGTGFCIGSDCKTAWYSAGTGLVLSGTTFGVGTQTWDDITQRAPYVAGYGSGFYQTSAASPTYGWPPGASSWWHLINAQHSNSANNYALQIVGSFYDQNLYFRKTNNSGTQTWSKFIVADGSGNVYLPGSGIWNSAGKVGIGTTVPDVKLNVNDGDIKITNGNLTFAGTGGRIMGVSKLTVTSIDPLYEIDGAKYATYVSDTIGYKTEMFGKVNLRVSNILNSPYSSYAIDFNKVERGSDLWLFWQTIAEGENMDDVSVYLTPEFDGRAWYIIDPAQKQIVIYGEPSMPHTLNPAPSLEVSYHLVAPRHDTALWPNTASTTESGTLLPLK